MHAFLIASRSINNYQLAISNLTTKLGAKQLPFVLQTIEDARNLKRFVRFVFNEKTAIIINDIDLASNQALNAFLKNLEEPNKNLIYILTASNLENVLPTITSRCEIVKVHSTKYLVPRKTINYKAALDIKDRSEAIKFVEDLIFSSNVKVRPSHMENYLQTLINLKANGNVSLQLTNLVVKMNAHG